MKEFNYHGEKFLNFAFAFALLAECAVNNADAEAFSSSDRNHAPPSMSARNIRNGGRIIVERTANFGNLLFLHMSIDGKVVADLGPSQRYEGFLSPGRHVLAVIALPKRAGDEPTRTLLTVKSGHIYRFTAVWDSDLATLRRTATR
jgi:hypothetical protein